VTVPPSSSAPGVAVVVGASSGIGYSTAKILSERGYSVVLAARGQDRLAALAAECLRLGAPEAVAQPVDVNDRAAVEALLNRAGELGPITVVVHTATVMAYGRMEDIAPEVFEQVLDTAIIGTLNVARASLKVFRQSGKGNLVIVNSLLGSIAAPQMGSYVAAKWGQAGLIRVLQLETRDAKDIHISSVSPGGVNTPIYSQAANITGRTPQPPPPIDPPEKVARAVVHCLDRPKARVSVGLANPLIVFGFRFLPAIYDRLVGPLLHLGSLGPRSTEPSEGNVFASVEAGEAEHGPWTNRWQIPKR
jgi:short-subunit dehydrogenase